MCAFPSVILPLILICTKDLELYLLLDHILRREDFISSLVGTLEEMRSLSRERRPAAILLECSGPAAAFRDTCLALRQDECTRSVPLIALVPQPAERDFVATIAPEIAEIVVRPIWPAMLMRALRAALEPRLAPTPRQTGNARLIAYADLRMNLATHRVWRGARELRLSPIEFKLLRCLLERPEEVVTRDELRSAAWQQNIHLGPRTVDVHVGRLRRALRPGAEQNLIRTIRSVGYALSQSVPGALGEAEPRAAIPRRKD